MTDPMHLANTPEICLEFKEAARKAMRRRRKKLEWTLKDIAGRTGVRFQQWHKYETGGNRLGVYRAVQFCAATQTPLSDLFSFLLPIGMVVAAPENLAVDEATFDTNLGAFLRLQRRSVGLLQEALAGSINVRFQQVQNYETGKHSPSLVSCIVMMEEAGLTRAEALRSLALLAEGKGALTIHDTLVRERMPVPSAPAGRP